MAVPKSSMSRPDYAHPPVVEVILGVQFERLAGFSNAHLGAFWKSLGEDWSTVKDAPPLEPQFEKFAESGKWTRAGVQLMFTQDFSSRIQIKNKDADRLVQVQNGRLHFNWLGQAGGPYPHYEKVREGFLRVLQRLVEFVAAEKLGTLTPNQWEVTYLNHIEKGTVWNTPRDWGFFRPLTGLPAIEGLIQSEGFGGEWHFVIPERRGRLHVKWQHGVKPEPEGKEVVMINLTARGALGTVGVDDPSAIATGLDLGHDTIVRSFEKLMSDEANKYWGLKHVGN